MNLKLKFTKKNILTLFAMQVFVPLLYASTLSKTGRLAGKALASQATQQGFRSTPNVISTVSPAVTNQFRPFSQMTNLGAINQPQNSLLIPKVIPTENESNFNMLKWLAISGLAVAADVAKTDKEFDFEHIDKSTIPNSDEAVAYLKYKLRNMKLAPDVDFEMIALLMSGRSYDEFDYMISRTKYRSSWEIHKKNYKEDREKNDRDYDPSFINMDILHTAVNDVRYGTGSSHYKWNLEIAWHEAGHALIHALYLNKIDVLDHANVIANGDTAGLVQSYSLASESIMSRIIYSLREENLREMTLAMLLAGKIAEQLFQLPEGQQLTEKDFDKCLIMLQRGKDDIYYQDQAFRMVRRDMGSKHMGTIDGDDYSRALYEARKIKINRLGLFGNTDKVTTEYEILKEAYLKTVELFSLHKKELREIAETLYDKGKVYGDEIYKIVGVNPQLLDFQDNRQLAEFEEYYPEYQ